MYIIRGYGIFAHNPPLVWFEEHTEYRPLACTSGAEGIKCLRKDDDGLAATSRFRAPRNISKHMRLFSVRGLRMTRTGALTRRESTMTNFKLFSAAMILSVAIATPAFAQAAVDEPGMQSFYQSLGVGSHNSTPASAFASTRSGSYASAPARHISSKRYANAHK
jgi:hypothetical protein